jgi:hypothetical protein
LLCFDASKTQDQPFQDGEKQNGIDPDDWQAVNDQNESPLTGVQLLFGAPTANLYAG